MSIDTEELITRLKSIKLFERNDKGQRISETHIVRPPRRRDLMVKFRNEAQRVLDDGRDRHGRKGVKNRQTQSSHFNGNEEWINSFVAIRIRNLPKKTNGEKMVREVNRLTKHVHRDQRWHGISLMETASRIHHSYTQQSIDIAWAEFWGMQEDLAHVA